MWVPCRELESQPLKFTVHCTPQELCSGIPAPGSLWSLLVCVCGGPPNGASVSSLSGSGFLAQGSLSGCRMVWFGLSLLQPKEFALVAAVAVPSEQCLS